MKPNERARVPPSNRYDVRRLPRRPPSRRAAAPERGVVVWVTGPPSSGKSTFGWALVEALRAEGRGVCLLDGDDVRWALKPRPGYDEAGRDDFYATLAALAAMLAHQGLVVVVPATAHRRAYRARARELAPAFVEVFVDVPPGERGRRDDAGPHDAARTGSARALPGLQVDYEAPECPDVIARHRDDPATVGEAVEAVRTRSARAASPPSAAPGPLAPKRTPLPR
jgi:adenylylsulfate kinase